MKIEFDFKRAGLVEARSLGVQQFFVNGGLMSEPNVYMVTKSWPLRPDQRRHPDDDTIQVFNMTKGELQRFRSDNFVAVLNVTLKVNGYADPQAESAFNVHRSQQSKTSQFVKNASPDQKEHTEYDVRWIVEVDAENALHAAQRAQEMMRDPNTTATCFNVTDPLGRVTALDLKDVPTKGE